MSPPTNMSPPPSAARRQVEFLKRQLWLIVLVVSGAIAIAAATSLAQQKVYRANSKIIVGSSGTLNPQFGNVIQPFTQTMSSLLTSDIIATRVIANLGLNKTTDSILSSLHVSSTPDSAVLQVSYDSHNPREAVRILSEIGSVFTARVHEKLGRPSGPNNPVATAAVWDPAHASSTPISPHPVRTLVFVGIIALALGIVLALLRETLDERIHKREELEELFGAPVIAVLPRSMLGRPLVDAVKGVNHTGLHAIDPLRLQLARDNPRERLIAITSGGPGGGKGVVAASIGLALALGGERVVCVDVSPNERRNLSYYLNANGEDGAAPHLEGPHDIEDALREINVEALTDKQDADGVPAQLDDRSQDSVHELSAAVTRNKRGRLQLLSLSEGVFSGDDGLPAWSIADLVTELKSGGRFVVVDAPSLPSAAAFALLSVSDRALVVAQESRTTKEQATSAREALATLQVLNYGVVSIGRTATAVLPYGRPRSRPAHPVSSRRARRAR
jgi:capsular polysaccharide biosynthesis protein/MinD-like ATPase involved in chromosome partitioning or flagellar assembly